MVTLDVVARMPDGKELAIRAEIGAPERQEDGSSVCRVSVAPLQDQGLDVRGVDSFHAVWLACALILKLLTHVKSAGALLLNPDGSAFPLELYLAGLDDDSKRSG
jgi:hypothetical protein